MTFQIRIKFRPGSGYGGLCPPGLDCKGEPLGRGHGRDLTRPRSCDNTLVLTTLLLSEGNQVSEIKGNVIASVDVIFDGEIERMVCYILSYNFIELTG